MSKLRKAKTLFKAATIAACSSMVGAPLTAGPALAWKSPSTTKTPIQHVVVIFQENVSFDHYFATYPVAQNSDGTWFKAQPGTPSVNGLTPSLLTNNPNFDGTIGNPFRLSYANAATCDQDHGYTDEQKAFDNGLMDMFPAFTNVGNCTQNAGHPNDLVMGYYDGNTTTALWNYAQNFAMNDNAYNTTFGPSSPGAINVVSGDTTGAFMDTPPNKGVDVTDGSLTDDAQPTGDVCTTRDSAHLTGKNIGNLLNDAGLTWGWFEGGFDLTITNPNGTTGCKRSHTSITGAFPAKVDYIPHHEPFQYYASTANPTHARPSSIAAIGTTDAANHQYDSHDFFDALAAGIMPNVVFMKAPGYQDGHAGYSSPLDEQIFLANTINAIEASKFWDSTLIVLTYDDSDGWYDHQMSPIIMHSQADATGGQQNDALTGTNLCGSSTTGMQSQGRCGYGPRLPFLVISPWAKRNFVDHTTIDQSSPIAFIEYNWGLKSVNPASGSDPGSYDQYAGPITNMLDFGKNHGQVESNQVFIDPTTGNVTGGGHDWSKR